MIDELAHKDIPTDANEPATKGDIYQSEKRIHDHFDAVVEKIEEDLKGANADEISSMKDTDNKLHERIVPLEDRAGIESPVAPHSLPYP